MTDVSSDDVSREVRRKRRGLLRRISGLLDVPMTILSFVWLGLMIVEFTSGLSPALERVNGFIWILFILHFLLEFWIAPEKLPYLRQNWLTAVALLLPALRGLRAIRILRVFRVARAGRGLRLVRWLTSLNRGMRAMQRAMRRRGLAYVLALTIVVAFGGAAGVYHFENPRALSDAGLLTSGTSGIGSYGEAVWWTAMMLTTMGSDYFPKSSEGRIIAWLLAVYAFAIFGYITATVASMIIRVEQPAATRDAQAVHQELAELRILVQRLGREQSR